MIELIQPCKSYTQNHQTIFGNSLEDANSVQDWKDGFGEGSFVVIKAIPKEPS